MFTLEQIQAIHANVKSGADFPRYIQELIQLGVLSYTIHVDNGLTFYLGRNNFSISSEAQYPLQEINSIGHTHKLEHALKIHQQGLTDYPTFCKQAAEAGVEQWVVDMEKMVCTYHDKDGNILVTENIPQCSNTDENKL